MELVGSDPGALDQERAVWTEYRTDLGCDFLPVVHIANGPTSKHRWGRSVLDPVTQLLDDVADTDTSAMSASRYLRDPTVAVSGATPVDAQMMPGRILGVGENGRMDVLDLAAGLGQLTGAGDRLLDRLATNAGIPAEALGRIDRGDLSGVALLLRWAPFAQIVGSMRMTREPKWALVWRMAQRLAQVQGALDPGPTPATRIVFGSFLPTDQATTVELVAKAVHAHVMSTATAVTMLVAAGVPVDDARVEVDRIRADDLTGANTLADALAGSPDVWPLLADRLGVDVRPPGVADGEPPVLDLA